MLRGPGLGGEVSDADPHQEGKPIPAARALAAGRARTKTARIVNAFVAARGRGAARRAARERGADARALGAAAAARLSRSASSCGPPAIAAYPMYRGVAQLAGMELFPVGEAPEDAFARRGRVWSELDFFFIHMKGTDMAGEDGNFDAKVAAIEAVDRALPASARARARRAVRDRRPLDAGA